MSHSPPKWTFTRMQRTADLNARQHAIIDLWEAWLQEGEGDLEVEGFTVPKLLDDLWALSVQSKTQKPTDLTWDLGSEESFSVEARAMRKAEDSKVIVQTLKRINRIN